MHPVFRGSETILTVATFLEPRFLPRAAAMADAARANGTRYIYMTQPWIVALFLDCEHSGVRGWRPQRSGPLLQCPNASTVAQFRRACTNGDIFFQAFPHNACPESYDASLFEARVSPPPWPPMHDFARISACFSASEYLHMGRVP